MTSAPHSSRPPDVRAAIEAAAWPGQRLAEALSVLAEAAGLDVAAASASGAPPDADPDSMNRWIESAAADGGFDAEPMLVPLADVDTIVDRAPVMLRLRALQGQPYLLLVGRRGHSAIAIGPDRARHRLPRAAVADAIREEFEKPVAADIDRHLDAMKLAPAQRIRARKVLMRERLAGVRFGGCWSVRLPAGADLIALAREAGVPVRLATATAAHLVQYVMWLTAWWLLARGMFGGGDAALWLCALLLTAAVPIRLIGTWAQSGIVTQVGRIIRRRMLHGALRMDAEEVRRRGEAALFGILLEASTIENTAVRGGLQVMFAAIELLAAIIVLAVAAERPIAALLLSAWIAIAAVAGWRYAKERALVTTQRLQLSNRMLESMLGHRTIKVQGQSAKQDRHDRELIEQYAETGRRMDADAAWISGAMARLWLLAGAGSLAVDVSAGPRSAAEFAMTVAGIMLAFRAFRRLATGLAGAIDGAAAMRIVSPLWSASSARTGAAVSCHEDAVVAADGVEIREASFRYGDRFKLVLRECSLRIERGARVLLEGASGSGKTTLALVLTGLRRPTSGTVTVDGRDGAALPEWRWRRGIVMAPQPHDNHLISGSLAFNLLMGRRWPPTPADFADAAAVCRELGLGDLLDRLPGGLNQTVGETGWQLSQGEQARVFLARALLQQPGVVVLDETFSALDPENVDRVMDCVQRRAPSVLAIAHT